MNKWNSILGIVLLSISLYACQDKDSTHAHGEKSHNESKIETYYTCSMHPQIKEKENGKCPICHMNLTKVEIDHEEDGHEGHAQTEVKQLWRCENFPDVTSEKEEVCPIDGSPMIKDPQKNPAAEIVARVKLRKSQIKHFESDVFPVTTMKMSKKIRLLGSVLQSEEKESSIPARVGGRVEKVYVRSTGSMIRVGDPVLEYYSPKLITAGEEYLLARKSNKKNASSEFKEMLNQSIEKLRLWGIKNSQFESWYRNGRVPKKIKIYSETTGIVRNKNAIAGKYFKEGQNFFELSDLSDVWVEMDVYEHDSSLVKLGQSVDLEFTAIPGQLFKGEIDFVNPVLNQKSRTLKVRTTVKNESGKLKPGMIANAVLKVELEGLPLVIPRNAIIDTGVRKVVWLEVSKKKYQAKTIRTGYESEGYVEVLSGLNENDRVVNEGNFLLDAQAQLFGGYVDMKNSTSSGHQH